MTLQWFLPYIVFFSFLFFFFDGCASSLLWRASSSSVVVQWFLSVTDHGLQVPGLGVVAEGLGCREACGLLRSGRTGISCTPCICGRVANHWTSREVPLWFLFLQKLSPLVKLPEIESGSVSCSAVSNCLREHSPGGGPGHPLQCSCLENPTDRGPCWATAHGVAKSWPQPSD